MWPSQRGSTSKAWCVRNAQPKPIYVAPFKPEPTRWQRPGPMNLDDWVNFYKWCQVNAVPVERPPIPRVNESPPTYERIPRMQKPSKPVVGWTRCESGGSAKNKEDQDIFCRLSKPRWHRAKYQPPPKELFPYRPRLAYQPRPRPEPGRPADKPKVPCCFQHEDVEAEFWATVRFPVSKSARKTMPSQKDCELSKPKTMPPKPHCPLPPEMLDGPPMRTKMSPRQWRAHLRRLKFLSQPSERMLADLPCFCDRW
ncbi:adhesive plaque matrix protein [Drosophila subobscura]|uniref:adhesive plaque matrix protein n=1 Tax=Drosophila subobscura TaxID=7241 RepID=UPI00155AF822|nr:adhesive plaque matrix protein [Drosophila subobscura]